MMYGQWTIQELKKELKKRNARLSGRKADLVERLEAYDRNANFGRNDALQPEYHMQLPLLSEYKDLHADVSLPTMTQDHVRDYLCPMDQEIDHKATELYNNKYVNYVRANLCPDVQSTYIRAEVRAEMKVNVSYITDISLSPEGVVKECQCECAAGMGPNAHCKHVRCVLHGLTEFGKSKKFVTLTSCTQVLQTFHQAKKHLGSPVKAEQLQLHSKKLDAFDFDPRPPQFRNMSGYASHFNAVVNNSRAFVGAPIMQLYPPANPYAVLHDHNYMQGDPQEQFLKKAGLRDISEIQIQCIERDTMSDRKVWKKERRNRLCSSDFGKLCKLTPRSSLQKLCDRLTSSTEIRTAAILHGRKYERAAVQKYEQLMNLDTEECGLFVSGTHPFLCSTPDRIVCSDKLLEVKCPFSAFGKAITPATVPYLELKDGKLSLKKDHDYFYQIQGQMFCVGEKVKSVDFTVFTEKDLAVMTVQRDDAFIEEMVGKLTTFYDNHFKNAVLDKFFFKQYSTHFC